MNLSIARIALRVTAPVFFGYLAIGIGFGFLLANAGYPWWMATMACLLMYTGSGQYFAVGQLSCGSPLGEILLVQLLLSLRHIFYGLSLLSKYKGAGWKKPYLVFAITDETFALIQGLEPPKDVKPSSFYLLVSVMDHLYWTFGSTIGALACTILRKYNLTRYLDGMDFALTALFIVLLIDQLQKTPLSRHGAVAGLCCGSIMIILCRLGFFASSNIILFAICMGLGVLLLIDGPKFFKSELARNLAKKETP